MYVMYYNYNISYVLRRRWRRRRRIIIYTYLLLLCMLKIKLAWCIAELDSIWNDCKTPFFLLLICCFLVFLTLLTRSPFSHTASHFVLLLPVIYYPCDVVYGDFLFDFTPTIPTSVVSVFLFFLFLVWRHVYFITWCLSTSFTIHCTTETHSFTLCRSRCRSLRAKMFCGGRIGKSTN